MKLRIKNMVCDRCIRVVREELQKLGLTIETAELGNVTVAETEEKLSLGTIRQTLQNNGFDLLEDHQSVLIEQIKRLLINEIYYDGEKALSQNYSDFLVKKVGYDYSYLSNMFSSVEKITIEKYIILQKIERAKELLRNGEKSLSEIAWQLSYSSVAHLSNQFKQVVGLSPTEFKRQNQIKRQAIDAISHNFVRIS